MKQDPRIDAYIAQSPDFAQPILTYLRTLVHSTCKDVEETIKWGFPHFNYKGQMMCSIAAFKKHCVFSFWKAALMTDKKLMVMAASETAMGHLGKLAMLSDIPAKKIMIAYIREAMLLNDTGTKLPPRIKKDRGASAPPDALLNVLKKNKKAFETYNAFSDSNKREYNEWIMNAKTNSTQQKRIEQAIEWMQEGKKRNWKYERC